MKYLLSLVAVLALFVTQANACQHLPAQALLQGVTCPTCGATAQAVVAQSMINATSTLPPNYQQPAPVVQQVQQPVVQYVQQPVQAIQRVVVQQPVVQYVQPQFVQSGYSSFQNVVTTPTVITNRGLGLGFGFGGPFGGGLNLNLGIGGGFNGAVGSSVLVNPGFGSNVIVNPSFGFRGGFHGGHR